MDSSIWQGLCAEQPALWHFLRLAYRKSLTDYPHTFCVPGCAQPKAEARQQAVLEQTWIFRQKYVGSLTKENDGNVWNEINDLSGTRLPTHLENKRVLVICSVSQPNSFIWISDCSVTVWTTNLAINSFLFVLIELHAGKPQAFQKIFSAWNGILIALSGWSLFPGRTFTPTYNTVTGVVVFPRRENWCLFSLFSHMKLRGASTATFISWNPVFCSAWCVKVLAVNSPAHWFKKPWSHIHTNALKLCSRVARNTTMVHHYTKTLFIDRSQKMKTFSWMCDAKAKEHPILPSMFAVSFQVPRFSRQKWELRKQIPPMGRLQSCVNMRGRYDQAFLWWRNCQPW